MTTTIFTAFLQTGRQAFGEDLLLLAAGVGLIILVFVLRRSSSGRGKTGVSKNSNKFADLTK